MGQACTSVLIVDHDPIMREESAAAARNNGYLATVVAHAGKALDALAADPQLKAVIIGNQWRGGLGGIALASTVRCFWPRVAIVLIVERELPNDADLPLDTVVLVRPYTPHQLVTAIESALQGQSRDVQSFSTGADPQVVSTQRRPGSLIPRS